MDRNIDLYSLDSSTTPLPLEGVKVSIYKAFDLDFSEIVNSSISDSEGKVTFLVTPGEFAVVRDAEGYYFDLQFIQVKNIDGQSYLEYGIDFVPAPMPDREVTIVYGFIRDIVDVGNAQPTLKVNIFTSREVVDDRGRTVVPFEKNVPVRQSDGFFSVGLIANSKMKPDYIKYNFIFSWESYFDNPTTHQFVKKVIVPDVAKVNLASLQDQI